MRGSGDGRSGYELSSIVDPKHERKVANDFDEALWEEAEIGLGQQSQIMSNYLVLMRGRTKV